MRAFDLVTRWMGVLPKFSHGTCIQTSNGCLIGHQAPNASDVIEYLGIPYAQPPVGHLRFAAPVAYQGDAPSPQHDHLHDPIQKQQTNSATSSPPSPAPLTKIEVKTA
ncbi:MAG: hypothetical protein Q9172_005880 [Xanthocarpia lactea]